jgi:putative membrane protein
MRSTPHILTGAIAGLFLSFSLATVGCTDRDADGTRTGADTDTGRTDRTGVNDQQPLDRRTGGNDARNDPLDPVSPANTQTPPGQGTEGQQIQLDTRQFVERAASSGKFEVQSSQLVTGKEGVDEKTREFAEMMIRDHEAANEELVQAAKGAGITVPDRLATQDERRLEQLRSLEAGQLEQTYRQLQITAHEEAISLFQRASQNLPAGELKQFAQKTLPKLREHLDHAKQLGSASNDGNR